MTTREKVATTTAGLIAVMVLGFGTVVVVKPAIDHWSDVYSADPFAARTTTEKVVKEVSDKPTETTTTTSTGSRSDR
jgi:hypothetical protein